MSALSGIWTQRRWVLAAAALVMLPLVGVAVLAGGHASPSSTTASAAADGSSPTATTTPSLSGSRPLVAEQQTELQQSLTRMRNQSPVAPATSVRYTAVSSQARQQPDLYAAAFTRQLLSQDYRAPRDLLLAWVQSESAPSTEPLVIGLTPVELQPRLALWSVQDDTRGPAPVPGRSAWAALAARGGYTTVQIQKVSEPVAWAAAVANGEISDPGATRRQIDAEVTVHTTVKGRASAARYRVSLTIQLEGPPARGVYGFVVAAIYNVAPII